MPLIKKHLTNNSQIGIWKINENKDDFKFATNISTKYHEYFKTYKNKNKQNQVLSTRLLAKYLYPNHSLIKNINGKPLLSPEYDYVSISNDNDLIVMIGSSEKCGIDIQSYKMTINKISDKFINKYDFSYGGSIEDLLWTWSAKESMYKIFGVPEIFFKDHLIIKKNGINQFYGECIHKKYLFNCNLNKLLIKNYFLVYTNNIKYI